MSLASETRRAVDEQPFLRTALRAGIVNYTAAARFLKIDGETDAVATALGRYAEELPEYEAGSRDVRVTMRSDIGPVDDGSDGLLSVGDLAFGPADGGNRTAIVATGEIDAIGLATAVQALSLADIEPAAAAVGDGVAILVVDRFDGANAVRTVENALDRVPV
ncbi:hypothetical protein OB905_04085 [Halobacteria archaeon AArc-dxtr1]|nr:hypothetical protein [Halobacteria archaeon AArc-dxtr1]